MQRFNNKDLKKSLRAWAELIVAGDNARAEQARIKAEEAQFSAEIAARVTNMKAAAMPKAAPVVKIAPVTIAIKVKKPAKTKGVREAFDQKALVAKPVAAPKKRAKIRQKPTLKDKRTKAAKAKLPEVKKAAPVPVVKVQRPKPNSQRRPTRLQLRKHQRRAERFPRLKA